METSHSSADQNTFCNYWFGIRLQNVEATRIQRRGLIIRARGGLYPEGGGLSFDVFFCLQIDGPITGRLKSEGGGGGAS